MGPAGFAKGQASGGVLREAGLVPCVFEMCFFFLPSARLGWRVASKTQGER
jgi:hypothetical protein